MKQAVLAVALLGFSLTPVPSMGQERKMERAKDAFYNERLEEAEQLTLADRLDEPDDPESYELRTTVLLFRLKAEVGAKGKRRGRDIESCLACARLLAEFQADLEAGLGKSRAILEREPGNSRAQFLLAKLILNRLWLNLQVLQRKKGWNDYKESSRMLDRVLMAEPDNVRALTARAWIEYVVGDQNFVVRALLGGGDKAKAIRDLRRAIALPGGEYELAEAKTSLVEMLASEGETEEARELAAQLNARFPENKSFRNRAARTTK